MGHYGVVVRGEEERRLRVHNNVPHEFSGALSNDDVVYALPIACPVEGMRDAIFGVLKNVFTRARSWLKVKANRSSPLSFRMSRP